MASEAVGDNMHMDTRVIKVPDFKCEVKLPPCFFEAAIASEAVKCNMHMDTIALVDAGIIGPLPSCYKDSLDDALVILVRSFPCNCDSELPKTNYKL